MASKKGEKLCHIAVIGMTGSGEVRGDQGVGKSCLCNRFMRPHADDYYPEHISVFSQYDFSSRIVNNDHFIFWGEVNKYAKVGECMFSVIEQTEFIDDSSFTPLRGNSIKPYMRRCTETKLSSPEKLMYICRDQVGDELRYEQKTLPEGKFHVDGFLLLFDVSRVKNRSLEGQKEFIQKLYQNVHKQSKKPIVLVATKCDNAEDMSMRECKTFASKNKLTLIETSAQLGVNVDLPFLLLAALIDKTKSRPKEISFLDANKKFKEILNSTTEVYVRLLEQFVTDYHKTWPTQKKEFERQDGYVKYIEIAGTSEARKLFRKHTQRLKAMHQQRKLDQYYSHFPDALKAMFPDLKSIDDRDWTACREALKSHSDFNHWFIVLEEPWDNDLYIDKDEQRIPFDVLTVFDQKAENFFMTHVNQLNAAKRKEGMKADFKSLLETLSDIVLPGSNFHDVQFHLSMLECFRELENEERVAIFLMHQQEIIRRAKAQIVELLLEKSEIFSSFDREGNIEEQVNDLQDELLKDKRYQVLSEMEQDRYVILLKHLAFTHNPVDGCFLNDVDKEKCMDKRAQQCLDRSVHKSPIKDSLNKWTDSNEKVNLLIIGEEGLADELTNEIKAASCDDDYTFDGAMYTLDIKTVEGDIIQAHNQFKTDFTPQAFICVFASLQSFQFIKSNLEKTGLLGDTARPILNLPVVLMFGRDCSIPESDVSPLRDEAQNLAERISDSQVVDIPNPDQTFYPNKKFGESQIHSAFQFVFPLVKQRARWMESFEDENPEGATFKIAFLLMCGDDFNPEFILQPLLRENNCFRTSNSDLSITVETFIGTEKRKMEVEVMSYHQAMMHRKDLHHGYIMAYSAKRRASLEVLRSFLKRISPIPAQIVAVMESGPSFFNQQSDVLVTEGNKLADATENAKFLHAGKTFQGQTLAYSTFLKEAYERRHETEMQHNDMFFRKLPSPPMSPATPYDRPRMDMPPSDDDSQEQHQSGDSDNTPSINHSVVHDHLVKPSEIRNKQKKQDDDTYATVNPLPRSVHRPQQPSAGEAPIYATVNKPRRIGSERGYHHLGSFAYAEPTPHRDQPSTGVEGWVSNEAYAETPIRPYPYAQKHTPSPYATVPIFPHQPEGDSSSESETSKAPQYATPGEYNRPITKPKPPVAPKPRKLDPAKYSHLENETSKLLPSRPPSLKFNKPTRRASAPKTPEREEYGDYSSPADAIRVDRGRDYIAQNQAIYSEPVDTLMKQVSKGNKKTTPYSKPFKHHKHTSDRKGKDKDLKDKDKDLTEKEKKDRFLLELEKLIGQAKDDDPGPPEKNQAEEEDTGTLDPKKIKKPKTPKIKKNKKKSKKPKGHLRGHSIEELEFGPNNVPPFVEQCVEFIEEIGITSEGIYRAPGKNLDIDEILKKFDEDYTFILTLMDPTPNSVASALKRFFKEMPEPILPYKMQQNLIKMYNELSEDDFVLLLYDELRTIGEKRLQILTFIMYHLKRITDHSSENKMTADNISTCWWPSLLHPQSQSFEDLATEGQLANIFRLFIERIDDLCGEKTEEEPPEEEEESMEGVHEE